MKISTLTFPKLVKEFIFVQKQFDEINIQRQEKLLSALRKTELSGEKSIQIYHDSLLFSLAYPPNTKIRLLVEKEMNRLIEFVKSKNKSINSEFLLNSGISGSNMCASFTLAFNDWLLENFPDEVELDSLEGDKNEIATLLHSTLDPVEAELKSEEKNNWKYFKEEKLKGITSKKDLFRFYIKNSQRLPGTNAFRESLFSSFGLYARFKLNHRYPTLSNGRSGKGTIFFHDKGIIKRTTLSEVFSAGAPQKIELSKKEKIKLAFLARASMGSLMRETDPFSFPNHDETELLDMGRGITIALFYMKSEMKNPLQVYAGYLLMKNQIPMAYGGGWILGKQSGFGVNVLPPYRGGESAWVVGQLLRAYKFNYNVSLFSVDPYQIGKNNSEGIRSGAFWFYYRLGFRPYQKELAELAEKEFNKLTTKKNYRTSEKTLKRLADSTLLWEEKNDYSSYINIDDVSNKITEFVNKNFRGDRNAAESSFAEHRKVKGLFLQKNLALLYSIGAFEKLKKDELKGVEDAFSNKGKDEKAFIEMIQRQNRFFEVLKK